MMGQSEPHLPLSTNKQDMIKTLLPLADLEKTPSLDESEIAELHHMQLVHACWANERSGLETPKVCSSSERRSYVLCAKGTSVMSSVGRLWNWKAVVLRAF